MKSLDSVSRRSFLNQLTASVPLAAAAALNLEVGSERPEKPNILWEAGNLSTRRNLSAPKTYTNPVYAGSMPDPFVLQHQSVYYSFGTTGGERKSDGRIFNLLRSTNLVDWKELGGALTPPTSDTDYQYWAPEVAHHNGTFFLYYSMGGKEEEKFELRVAKSSKPQGPYTDVGVKLLACDNNRFTIDAHPFQDEDGRWYLFYARNFPDKEGGAFPGTALVVDKLVGMTKLAGECRTVLRARHPWTLYQANRRMEVYGKTFDWHTIEGAFVRKHAGRYYCFYSGSNYQTANYGVDYAVADSVMGPYTGQGTEPRVLKGIPGKVRGPGHHSIIVGPDGKTDYIVYHAWDKDMKVRQLCIDELLWTPDGPRCKGPTFTPQPRPTCICDSPDEP